jgi:4-hydroxyproline epimerase
MTPAHVHRIRVIDTHTGGEPTRVVISGGPSLKGATLVEQRTHFATEFDDWRRAMTCEPRGSDCMVGALLTAPERSDSLAGVIFFNNVGYLNMCGHGTMGVAVALAHADRLQPGRHALDTPAGQVWFELLDSGRVRIENVPSYRFRSDVEITLASGARVRGDVAWGGNWFYLCEAPGVQLHLNNLAQLVEICQEIRQALKEQGITGAAGAEIDHVELIAPSSNELADAQNFVLCPGGAYDRSPCGTGTSAKVACLAASGKLKSGELWRQASLIGSTFEATYRLLPPSTGNHDPLVHVTLVGTAYVNAETMLVLDPRDPFCMGIPT